MPSQPPSPKKPHAVRPPRPADFHVAVDVVLLSLRNDLPHIGVVQRRGTDACIDQHHLARRSDPTSTRRVVSVERHPQHHWALPGGHVGNTLLGSQFGTGDQPDATLEHAALRVVRRETNVSLAIDDLHQIGAFGDQGRDPRSGHTISVAYLAIIGAERELAVHPDDAVGHVSRVQFRPVVDVLARPNRLEFDHEDIVLRAIALARTLVTTTPLATKFLQHEFTMGELRRVYEALFHESLDSAEAAERPGHADSVRAYLAKLERYSQSSAPELVRTFNELAQVMPRAMPVQSLQEGFASRGAPEDSLSSSLDFARLDIARLDFARQAQLMSRLVRQSSRVRAPRPPKLLKSLDPTNFARKVQKLNILAPIEGESRPTFDRYGKPAALFCLNPSREHSPFLLRLDSSSRSDSSETE